MSEFETSERAVGGPGNHVAAIRSDRHGVDPSGGASERLYWFPLPMAHYSENLAHRLLVPFLESESL
jgi:hypothetical protein